MRGAGGGRRHQAAARPAADGADGASHPGAAPRPGRACRDLAFLAALHALCLKLFYPYALDSCLELDAKSVAFGAQAPGLSDTGGRGAARRAAPGLGGALPRESGDAVGRAAGARSARAGSRLFAHCVALTVNAVHEAWNRRPRQLAHADLLAGAVQLDMAARGLDADGGQLPGPGHQGAHPAGGAGGEGRARRPSGSPT